MLTDAFWAVEDDGAYVLALTRLVDVLECRIDDWVWDELPECDDVITHCVRAKITAHSRSLARAIAHAVLEDGE